MIRLYLKIPENSTRLILKDRFWFVCILLTSVVKVQFFAHFPVDHLSYPVMTRFELLCVSLLYSLIIGFIGFFFLSPHNLHLQFCCVLSIFALI